MGRTRRGFTPEYQDEAVKLVINTAWFTATPNGVSGSRKILADLRVSDGEVISRKTVAKTMRKLHLVGVCPKRW